MSHLKKNVMGTLIRYNSSCHVVYIYLHITFYPSVYNYELPIQEINKYVKKTF